LWRLPLVRDAAHHPVLVLHVAAGALGGEQRVLHREAAARRLLRCISLAVRRCALGTLGRSLTLTRGPVAAAAPSAAPALRLLALRFLRLSLRGPGLGL